LASENVDRYSGEAEDRISKRLDRTMAAVPCGLPLLPPHWIFTVNIWSYEIVGKYQTFTVIDNDNEVIPKPYFGHKGQRYVRESIPISHPFKKDENGIALNLGTNKMITFYFSGYAMTIVGPGPKGVGDKIGGSNETSEDYENLLKELGGRR